MVQNFGGSRVVCTTYTVPIEPLARSLGYAAAQYVAKLRPALLAQFFQARGIVYS